MRITFEMDLSLGDEIQLKENSVERLLNAIIKVCKRSSRGDSKTVLLDVNELKPLITRVWINAQDALFKEAATYNEGLDRLKSELATITGSQEMALKLFDAIRNGKLTGVIVEI